MAFHEPAFHTVFRGRCSQRRPMLVITLTGALAAMIFVPLLGAVADGIGWRGAAVACAVTLVAVNLPIHLAMWRSLPARPRCGDADPGAGGSDRSGGRRVVLQSGNARCGVARPGEGSR
jgi:predicted MFS family arabinose efflux permease